ncbi:MAG: hypothetical protein QXV83_02865 [Candidatus Anstonellaceae archaeon]
MKKLLFQIFQTKIQENQKEKNQQNLEQNFNNFMKELKDILYPKKFNDSENVANYIKIEEVLKRLKKEDPEKYEQLQKTIKEYGALLTFFVKKNKNNYYLAASFFKFLSILTENFENLQRLKGKSPELTNNKEFFEYMAELVKKDMYDASKEIEELYRLNEEELANRFAKKKK